MIDYRTVRRLYLGLLRTVRWVKRRPAEFVVLSSSLIVGGAMVLAQVVR